MSTDPVPAPAAELPQALRDLAAFVGLDESDLALVRRTAPAVLEREGEITAALYEHFLQFPASARFFLQADGTPDRARIERRRHSLGRWLRGPRRQRSPRTSPTTCCRWASRTAIAPTGRAA